MPARIGLIGIDPKPQKQFQRRHRLRLLALLQRRLLVCRPIKAEGHADTAQYRPRLDILW